MRRVLTNTPLRVILIVPFLVQITAVVGLTAWLSIRNGQKAVDSVANNLWQEITARTVQYIDEYTQIPQDVIVDTLANQQLNLVDLTEPDILTRYLWHQMRDHQGLFITAVGYETGNVVGVGVTADGQLVTRAMDVGQTQLHTYAISGQGDRGELIRADDFDLKNRPWYREAVDAGQFTWTGIYPNYNPPFNILSAASPIYDPETGQLIGVTNATLSLWQISDFLEQLEIGESGEIFIIERSGELVASSTGELLSPLDSTNSGEARKRLNAVDSNNTLVRQTAAHLLEQFGNLNQIQQVERTEFTIEGEREIVQITPFSDEFGLDWLIVIVVPESDFMGQIQANTRNTILLCLGALVLATASSILTARWITKPVLRLNQVAKKITQNSLASRALPEAIAIDHAREISELSHSFVQMTQQLQASFAALQNSEANFKNMAANVPGAIFRYILYPDGTDAVLYMSPGCYQLWEIEASVVEQDASVLWEMVDPADLPGMQASVMQSAQTLEMWHYEWRITTPSGCRKWLQGNGRPIRQPDESVYWHSVILDVSDRKLDAIQLQDLTNRLELATQSAQMGIWDWDMVRDRLIWDDRMYDLYGIDFQDFDGVYAAWEAAVYPDDFMATQTALQQALASGNDFDVEFRIVWPDGTIRHIEAHAIVQRDATGEPIRLIGVNLDITDRKQAELALEQELLLSQALFNTSIDGIVLLDSQGNVLQASASFAQMLGYTIAETHKLNLVDWDAQWSREKLQTILAGTMPLPPYFETRHRRKDGSIYDVEISYSQEILNGERVHFCMCRNISDRKLAESERTRLLNVLEASLNEIYLFNSDTLRFEYANQGALQNLGYSLEQLQQMTPLDIKPELWVTEFEALIAPLRQREAPTISFETVHQRADGSHYPVEVHLQLSPDHGQSVFLAIVLDISDRKRAEAQLIHQALHDSLTDLPNRALLTSRLESSIQRAKRSPTYHFAILFLDLDRFKVINDSLGHLVGDELLITVAHKLQNIIRATDVAARLGGDEFVVLLEHIPNIQAVIRMAERLLNEFSHATVIDNHQVFVSTSIGIVWGTDAYTAASDLLRDADIALYRAKARGRGRYEIFDVEMHVQTVKRMTLEQDLRKAIEQQEFVPYYQPIVDLKTRRITGFEALIRWQHPHRGFISPADFIPVAEETGLILPISRWMLQKASEQVAIWQRQFQDTADLRISINLSSQDLRQPSLVEMVQQALQESQLPATSLTLEITESMLIENIEVAITLLSQLREIGIRISIDDFGTGYSSLSYLYNLPANYLKIDQSFVSNMQMGDRNHKIVQAIVGLSDQLELAAIAEGIETEQQLLWLKELGCELGQGYLLARPLAPEAVTELLTLRGRLLC